MLQQNNNNNYPCLDRAILQDSGKSGVPFASPLEFGDMSLIKTLRAWARSGMSAKARGGSAPLHHHLAKSCQQSSGSGQGPGAPLTGRTGHARVAGGGQAGLGALVTVATLKASEGGRQTQTRCLLLKAEGRNYVCAVSGANRGGPAGQAPPSRATLVGSWLRETVVGSKEVSGAKSTSQNGQCDGEVFRVKPRPAKKWRKLSNSAASFAAGAETAPGGQEHDSSIQKLDESQQKQRQDGAKSNCASARLNVHGRKQTRGSAQRGNSRTKERRGPARPVSRQNSLHDTAVLAKENVDLINVPCAEHCSRRVKADPKKTWSDCTTGSESKEVANRDVTEPSLQISHFKEPPNREEENTSLHNSLGEVEEETIKSPDRTGDTVCSVKEKDQTTKLRDTDPAEEVLSSRWVDRNLSPERRCCTELGLDKQHCCCKDLDTDFTNSKDLPEPGLIDKSEEEIVDLNRLSLTDIKPPYGHLCAERDSERGDELDGRVENHPESNLLSASPQTEKEGAPQGLVNVEARSGQNPDEAHAAEDHGKEGQLSARALRTFPLAKEGGGGGGGGEGSGEEQRDSGIRSTDNNLPWTCHSCCYSPCRRRRHHCGFCCRTCSP
ncbi:uncharacterized protein LOC116221760 [Clupea harengus]|uniref:Uncharacterized protein LOC116221760 n=1 Tax=Clupea harengus TaxID=7950 RepID=A0A6P8FZ55_CLUHA|nr:uncharacterized protein LOC116221760 [Clupea harengus]